MLLALIPASLTQKQGAKRLQFEALFTRSSWFSRRSWSISQKVLVSVRKANVIGNRLTSLVEGRKSNPQIKSNQASGLAARLRKVSRTPLELADNVALPFPSDVWSDPIWRVLLSRSRTETVTGLHLPSKTNRFSFDAIHKMPGLGLQLWLRLSEPDAPAKPDFSWHSWAPSGMRSRLFTLATRITQSALLKGQLWLASHGVLGECFMAVLKWRENR